MSIADTASWQNPRVLRKALTTWACRDTTRPDPKARAAGDDVLAAINAMQAELDALYVRVHTEIADNGQLDDVVEAVIYCGADWGSATASRHCILPDGHQEAHKDRDGREWFSGSPDYQAREQAPCGQFARPGQVSPARPAPDACMRCGQPEIAHAGHAGRTADIAGNYPSTPAPADLASCGHPRNEDGECDCAWWPERAPAGAVHSAAGLAGDRPDDDTWTDAELAALPPMFSQDVKVGPWPYARAAA